MEKQLQMKPIVLRNLNVSLLRVNGKEFNASLSNGEVFNAINLSHSIKKKIIIKMLSFIIKERLLFLLIKEKLSLINSAKLKKNAKPKIFNGKELLAKVDYGRDMTA